LHIAIVSHNLQGCNKEAKVSRFLKIPKLPGCTTAAGINLFFAVFAMQVAKPYFIIP